MSMFESPSGRRSLIDDGSARCHQRVQCERDSRSDGWFIAWPAVGGCPIARGEDIDRSKDCGCGQMYVADWPTALKMINSAVSRLKEHA